MPQVDIEILVRGEDRKVACETLEEAGSGGKQRQDWPPAVAVEVEDPDLPAESYEVPIGEEIEWADLNAIYDREDSTKGSTNPKSSHANPLAPAASNSQRFSANHKAKPPIIGLPSKIHHSGYDGRSARRRPQVQIFTKKAAGAGGVGGGSGGSKSTLPDVEPGSPKVSCFGKVLSDRERERCRRELRGAVASEVERKQKQRGCWRVFATIFRRGRGALALAAAAAEEVKEEKKETQITVLAGREPESAAPGLGGTRRFASGRRAASWGAEVEERLARSSAMDRVG